eukprot:3230637-Lingulodinium_polyedra.AAC.1
MKACLAGLHSQATIVRIPHSSGNPKTCASETLQRSGSSEPANKLNTSICLLYTSPSPRDA